MKKMISSCLALPNAKTTGAVSFGFFRDGDVGINPNDMELSCAAQRLRSPGRYHFIFPGWRRRKIEMIRTPVHRLVGHLIIYRFNLFYCNLWVTAAGELGESISYI
jgi:hypothetical protein